MIQENAVLMALFRGAGTACFAAMVYYYWRHVLFIAWLVVHAIACYCCDRVLLLTSFIVELLLESRVVASIVSWC